jgi:hypothetical protein
MRFESSLLSLSWIPSEAVVGMVKAPFEMGVAHYDPPPPDVVEGDDDVDALLAADGCRFANRLRAWIEVQDGQIVDHGQSGRSWINTTTVGVGLRVTFHPFALPDIEGETEVGDGWVRFTRTAGGQTGAPAPRRVSHPPFVQFRAPTAWTTLRLTLHADGRVEHELVGASSFPRHWLYDGFGKLSAKSGLIDFKEWYRHAFGVHSPWGDDDSPAVMAAAETALERELSVQLLRGDRKPDIRKVKAGGVICEQGAPGDALYFVLDGIVAAAVDGEVVAEYGPGTLHGERALVEAGVRTSTLTAVTACKLAVAPADAVDPDRLRELAAGHRREDRA